MNHGKNYAVATNLRNSLAEILEYLENEQLDFHVDEIRLRMKLAFIDMFNVKDAIGRLHWNRYNQDNEFGKELFRQFGSNFKDDIEGIRNTFSGHFDPEYLHEVANEEPVFFRQGINPKSQQIGIFVLMLEKCINKRKGKLNDLFEGNCELMLHKEGQEKLRSYVICMIEESIRLCDYVIEKSAPHADLPTLEKIWRDLFDQMPSESA
ncbi:hypothetical protein C4G68_RS22645 [Vibrio parahaemolyticus]|nr:hypothetical protein [Vibrio parahaemolyticus]